MLLPIVSGNPLKCQSKFLFPLSLFYITVNRPRSKTPTGTRSKDADSSVKSDEGKKHDNLDVFNRLLAKKRDADKELIKKKRENFKLEMQECTFSPQISATARSSESRGDIFTRLQDGSDRIAMLELQEKMKIQRELKECSFSPSLPLSQYAPETVKNILTSPPPVGGMPIWERLLAPKRDGSDSNATPPGATNEGVTTADKTPTSSTRKGATFSTKTEIAVLKNKLAGAMEANAHGNTRKNETINSDNKSDNSVKDVSIGNV